MRLLPFRSILDLSLGKGRFPGTRANILRPSKAKNPYWELFEDAWANAERKREHGPASRTLSSRSWWAQDSSTGFLQCKLVDTRRRWLEMVRRTRISSFTVSVFRIVIRRVAAKEDRQGKDGKHVIQARKKRKLWGVYGYHWRSRQHRRQKICTKG